MKKFCFIILILFFISNKTYANQCKNEYNCSNITPVKNTVSTIVSKMTGFNFLQIQTVELAITHYIKKETKNDVKVNIKAKSARSLIKYGEFEKLTLTAKKLYLEDLILSDFKMNTICPYNKILIDNEIYKFPYTIPAEFSATVTNDDLNTIIAKYSDKINSSLGGNAIINSGLSNSRLNISVDFSTPIIKKTYKFSVGLAVKNNRIVFTNYNNSSNKIILKKILNYTAKLFPLSYTVKIGQNAYCRINIKNLDIINDKIYLKGIFIIPKNCDIT